MYYIESTFASYKSLSTLYNQYKLIELLSPNHFWDGESFAMANSKVITYCSMISSGYGKKLIKVYIVMRKSIIDEALYRGLSFSHIQKKIWFGILSRNDFFRLRLSSGSSYHVSLTSKKKWCCNVYLLKLLTKIGEIVRCIWLK